VAVVLAQAQRVRWQRPPAGTLRRGWWVLYRPRVAVAAAIVLVVATLAVALYRRLRRR
jgi:hypothetical protein